MTEINNSKLLPEAELVDGILDELIPQGMNGKIPSAGSLGISNYLEEICASDEIIDRLFERGFALADQLVKAAGINFSALSKEDRLGIVKLLETSEPEFFSALIRHTYMGYYSRGDVRKALGLSQLPVHPHGYEVQEESCDLLDTLTAPVRERGDCYRF